MDPRCAVAEYLCLDREEFRRGVRAMKKTVNNSNAREEDFVTLRRADHGNESCLPSEFLVEVAGLKRKRDDFEMNCGRLNLEDELIVAPLHARSIVLEQTLPTAPGGNNIVLTHGADSDDEDGCVIVGCRMPQSALTGARAGCNFALTHDSDADLDDGEDDDCVIVGCLMPPEVVISNSCSDEELIGSEAGENFSALESDNEISAPVWDTEDDISLGWFD